MKVSMVDHFIEFYIILDGAHIITQEYMLDPASPMASLLLSSPATCPNRSVIWRNGLRLSSSIISKRDKQRLSAQSGMGIQQVSVRVYACWSIQLITSSPQVSTGFR